MRVNDCEQRLCILIDVEVEGPLNFDPNNQTLTCHSTGGPATYVIWTKNYENITEGINTVLNDALNATYTHTLAVRERGNYTCTVYSNKDGSPHRSSPPRLLLGAILCTNT